METKQNFSTISRTSRIGRFINNSRAAQRNRRLEEPAREEFEYEQLDTGFFDADRYFDVFIE